jgi:hypothetical protein
MTALTPQPAKHHAQQHGSIQTICLGALSLS